MSTKASTQKNTARNNHVLSYKEPEADDRALAEALRKSTPGAMELFYERYANHVQRVLARVLGVDPILPELLHDVFIEAFTSVHSIKDGAKLKGWLTSIAVFTARGHIRKKVRNQPLWFGESLSTTELAVRGADLEMREALRCTYHVLDHMSADDRIAFALRYMEGMELTEVADACRVSLATIKRRLGRAQKRFLLRAVEHTTLREWIEKGARWGVR